MYFMFFFKYWKIVFSKLHYIVQTYWTIYCLIIWSTMGSTFIFMSLRFEGFGIKLHSESTRKIGDCTCFARVNTLHGFCALKMRSYDFKIKALAICDLLVHQHPPTIYHTTQPAFTCSKLTIETLEQGVKYVQS